LGRPDLEDELGRLSDDESVQIREVKSARDIL
jgi:hypothetical protein